MTKRDMAPIEPTFEDLAEQIFERKETPGYSYRTDIVEGGKREYVNYVPGYSVEVEVGRTADEEQRYRDTVNPHTEFWIMLPNKIPVKTALGMFALRQNLRISIFTHGEYLETVETTVLPEEPDVPEEPMILGYQYWPLTPESRDELLKIIAPE